MAKRFTLIIIPGEDDNVRRVRLSYRTVAGAAVVCLLFFASLIFFAHSYLQSSLDLTELHHLRLENGQQRQDLQQLLADLEEMRHELNYLAETEARVRQLADLDEPTQAVPVAMGGIPDTGNGEGIDDIQKRINQMQLAIDLRRRSQEDVRNLLNDQVSLSKATPKGWPTKGWLTSYFGMRSLPELNGRRMHEGLDIAANVGTPVLATAAGTVARVEYSPSYGKTVVIDHGYGYRTLYGHNSRTLVKVGQRVSRGEKIAEVGNTGRSTGPHLHYEVQLNGVPVDPRKTL